MIKRENAEAEQHARRLQEKSDIEERIAYVAGEIEVDIDDWVRSDDPEFVLRIQSIPSEKEIKEDVADLIEKRCVDCGWSVKRESRPSNRMYEKNEIDACLIVCRE